MTPRWCWGQKKGEEAIARCVEQPRGSLFWVPLGVFLGPWAPGNPGCCMLNGEKKTQKVSAARSSLSISRLSLPMRGPMAPWRHQLLTDSGCRLAASRRPRCRDGRRHASQDTSPAPAATASTARRPRLVRAGCTHLPFASAAGRAMTVDE